MTGLTAKRDLTAQSKENAWDIILGLVKECGDGVSDCEAEAVALAELWLIDPSDIPGMFAGARKHRDEQAAKAAKAAPQVEVKPKSFRRSIGKSDLFIWREPQPKEEVKAEPASVAGEAKGKADATVILKKAAELIAAKAEAKAQPSVAPKVEPDEEEEATGGALVPVPNAGLVRSEIILPVAAKALQQVELLNQKHAVIGNYGSKCAVLSWERWNVNRDVMVPTFQTFTDFRNRYMNRYVEKETEDGVKKIAAGKFWLSHPGRLTYEGVAFEPGAPECLVGNRLNLWRDFAITPKEGCWDLMHDHIYTILAGGDTCAGRYIEWWNAWLAQNPGLPAEAVLALKGEEGAGKGVLARALLKWFGIYGLPISDPKHLIGAFSGHLQHCCYLYLDEAFAANSAATEGRLKNLVTEPTITIEPKYFQPFQVPNLLHILLASNNRWVVPAGHGSRRYAVYKSSNARVGDFEYFNRLNAELDGGGAEAMLYDLLRLDLGGWHPKQIYETDELLEQKSLTLHGLDAWIEALLQEGVLPNAKAKYPNRSLTRDLVASARRFDPHTNDNEVPRRLQEILLVTDYSDGSARGWKFLPLPECRGMWETRNGGRWKWRRALKVWGEAESILDRPASEIGK